MRDGGGPPGADGMSEAADVAMHLAYAEAAVMLVECLMLALMEKEVLSLESLTQAVEAANALFNAHWVPGKVEIDQLVAEL